MLIQFSDFVASDVRNSSFDVCIAGSGVAGITLARQLAKAGSRVLLLEGGDIDFTEESQDLYRGSNIGRDYYELDIARLRYLGGTSNHWAGYCRPLDSFDFEKRDDIEGSGWPISKDDLSPYLEPASKILEVDNSFPDEEALDEANNNLRFIKFQLSPPVRFRDKYLQELQDSEQIWTVVNANLVDIQLHEGLGAVKSLTITDQQGAQRIDVTASAFVLALGGIENARTLLNANSQIAPGVGNGNDLVGRYFMEHFELDVGHVLLQGPMDTLFPGRLWQDDRAGRGVSFAVTRQFMHATKTLNCELRLAEISGWYEVTYTESLKARVKQMICDNSLALNLASFVDSTFKQTKCMFAHYNGTPDANQFDAAIGVVCEQAPNPASRVLLAGNRDRLGLQEVALDWKLLDIDKATLKESAVELGRTLAAAELGRVRVADWLVDEQADVAGLAEGERGAGFHHIGTTRMGHGPKDGVVDRDGQVFGIDNLYIAGSSVFTTGGHVPPTFTIVQMTLRLADHLDSKLA